MSFANYKTNSGLDLNSIWHQPDYINSNDLHIHDLNLNGAATVLTEVTHDIDGQLRDLTNPDIGADEVYIYNNDIELYAIKLINDTLSIGNNQIRVSIRNMGISTITSDSLHYSIDNGPITSIKWTGNLLPHKIDSLILIGSSIVTQGHHTIKAWSTTPNNTADQKTSNDFLEKSFYAEPMPVISIISPALNITIPFCHDSIITNLQIQNIGIDTLNVEYTLNYDSTSSSTPTNWLIMSSSNSSIAAGATDIISVIFRSEGLPTGIYTTNIKATTNSPLNRTLLIPCTLTVLNQISTGVTVSNDTIICPNSPITLYASGGSSYLWNNGDINNSTSVSPMSSTIFSVKISDGICSTTDSIIVIVSDPTPNLGADTTLCSTQVISLNAGSGNNTYDWSNGSTNQTIIIDSTGVGIGNIMVDVEVEDYLGCIGKDTIMITFVDCTSLNNIDEAKFIISIFPNPTKGLFTIISNETNIEELNLEVLDVNGRIVYKNQINNTKGIISENIDLSNKAKGIYIVRLSNGSLIKTFKVVVQ